MADAVTPDVKAAGRSTGSLVLLLLFARVAAAAMSSAVGLVVPRLLSVDQSANYGIIVGVALMFVVLTDLGLTTSTARALAEGRVDGDLWARVARLRALAALGGAALFFAAAGALEAGVHFPAMNRAEVAPSLLVMGGVLVIAASMSGVAAGLLPTLRRVNTLMAITIVQPMLEFGGIIIAWQVGAGATGVVMASTAAALIVGCVGIFVVARTIGGRTVDHDHASDLAAIRAYGWPMFLVAISFTLFGQVDQIVLYVTRSASEAAAYIWSWRLIALMHMPGLAAATIVAPRLAAKPGAAHTRAHRDIFAGWLRLLLVAYVGIAVVACAMSPYLVPVALGHKYADAWPVFASLSVYALLLGIAPLVTMSANFLGGAGARVRLGLVTVTVNLLLDLALVPRFGTWGAAFGTSVAFSWYVGAHTRLTWRLLDVDGVDRIATRVRANASLAGTTIIAACVAAGIALGVSPLVDGTLGMVGTLFLVGIVSIAAYALIVAIWGRVTHTNLIAVARNHDDADLASEAIEHLEDDSAELGVA